MEKIKYINTGLYFRAILMIAILLGAASIRAQNNIVDIEHDMSELSIPSYRLVYGNASYRMEDFFLLPNSHKLLLLSGVGQAIFMLLDEQHLTLDMLEFASAPANIQFWMDSDSTFCYNSIFFYKSKRCPIDYKTGVAEFTIRRNSLMFNRCYPIDKRYSINHSFAQIKKFKVSTFALPANKRKRNGVIGVEVNGSTIIRHELLHVDSLYAEALFPFSELNGSLYVYDVLSHTLYRCQGVEHTYRHVHLSTSSQGDSAKTYYYRLLSDERSERLYLLESYRVDGENRRRGRLQTQFQQRLYSLDTMAMAWQQVELSLPHRVSQMRIDNGRVFVIFERPVGNGRSERLLYESRTKL